MTMPSYASIRPWWLMYIVKTVSMQQRPYLCPGWCTWERCPWRPASACPSGSRGEPYTCLGTACTPAICGQNMVLKINARHLWTNLVLHELILSNKHVRHPRTDYSTPAICWQKLVLKNARHLWTKHGAKQNLSEKGDNVTFDLKLTECIFEKRSKPLYM